MTEDRTDIQAGDVLARHGYPATQLCFVGAGEQSVCYAAGDIAVLLSVDSDAADMTGHTIPSDDTVVWCNDYAALEWLTNRAVAAGVRTPRILATGVDPRPYALIERAPGTPAAADSENVVARFGQLGQEIRKTNLVETTGFGMFVADGSGGYRGRFATWTDYVDSWLAVHLCVGESRPEDEKALNFLLAQGIVTERDLALVEAKLRDAQKWPVKSVLTHYDNRLANLVVAADGITVLDWGLSFAGIGIAQELVKLFEAEPPSMESPRLAAFLHRYGLSERECIAAIEDAKLMLVLDGLAMSYGWVNNPDRLGGVRAWLSTVKRISNAW